MSAGQPETQQGGGASSLSSDSPTDGTKPKEPEPQQAPPPSPSEQGGVAAAKQERTVSFDGVAAASSAAEPRAKRAGRMRTTSSAYFRTMLKPENRALLKNVEVLKAGHKLQAKQLADLQAKLEREARVVDATIKPEDLSERGPLSSSGAQGEVFKAIWKRMIPVAIKENKSGDWDGDLTAEMQLFLDLHHPHVVACYGILREHSAGGKLVNSIVTEKCTTSLDHFLQDNENWTCFRGSDRLNEINQQKSTILLHVSQGLSKLHDMGVLHRDIKCGNVLLDGASGECSECHHSGNWKICDFGEAKVLRPPFVRFAAPVPWRAGYAHSLVESKRFKPVTSSFLRSKGARLYCYINPGERLPSMEGGEEWTPCPHGGFAYLFGETNTESDERSCVFPQTMDDSVQHINLEFPQHLRQFGILPIRFKPFLDLDRLAYEMPTSIVGWLGAQGLGDSERIKQWDAIEEKLGHQCSSQNTLQDLSQLSPDTIITIAEEMELPGSTVARLVAAHKNLRGLTDTGMLQLAGLGEIYGDLIKGHISPCVELDQRLTEADRRKARIPADATHCVWAYQAEGFNVEQLTDEHKKVIDESCGEFAFASLGSFIYFKDVGGDGPPNVVTVNALGVGIGLETDIYAFGIVMWEVWTRCVAWHWMGANAEFQICNRVGILKHRPRMPPFIGTANPSRLATMIRSCLHDDPAKRPTAAQLVEAQLEMVKNIRRMQVATKGPVRERDAHNSDDVDAALDAESEQFWTSAGQFTLHPNHLDDQSGRFELTVIDIDRNDWIENALVGDEDVPADLEGPRDPGKNEKLGIIFNTTNKLTGEKIDHWPKIARVDDGFLASPFPEIRVNVKLEAINGQPVPATFKQAVPLLKKRPFTLEFTTLEDAVDTVLAPAKKFGVHAPIVAAAMKGGIQAAYLVKRFENNRSHHKTLVELQAAKKAIEEKDKIIEQKDAELEKLKEQVLAIESKLQKASGDQLRDPLGQVPKTSPKAVGA